MRTEYQSAIAQLCHEKGLPQDRVMEAVANALLAAYRKSIGGGENIRIEVERSGEVHIWTTKRVVAQVGDPAHEISLGEAQQVDEHAALGQQMDVETPEVFNKIPAQAAKQVILQRIREAEQEHLFEEFADRKDDLVVGTVLRVERNGDLILELGKLEGLLKREEQLPSDRFKVGQRVRVYLFDLHRGGGRGVQGMVSRTHRNIIKRLFELEVPEIYDGTVEIKAIAREPGSRSKVAVWARQESIDPIGACIGVRGTRINNVINELNGEKIDIIQWSPEPAQFVANALSPVKPLHVELREEGHTARVTVPERQLSLAIGKDGQNARLAAKLTGWRIDVLRPEEGAEGGADASGSSHAPNAANASGASHAAPDAASTPPA